MNKEQREAKRTADRAVTHTRLTSLLDQAVTLRPFGSQVCFRGLHTSMEDNKPVIVAMCTPIGQPLVAYTVPYDAILELVDVRDFNSEGFYDIVRGDAWILESPPLMMSEDFAEKSVLCDMDCECESCEDFRRAMEKDD